MRLESRTLPMAILLENLFDAHPEQPCHPKGQRQRGIILPRLNRVHGLAGDTQPLGQVPLGPRPLGAEHPQPVLHWYRRRITAWLNDHTPKIQAQRKTQALERGPADTNPAWIISP